MFGTTQRRSVTTTGRFNRVDSGIWLILAFSFIFGADSVANIRADSSAYTDGVYDGNGEEWHELLKAVLHEHYRRLARDIGNALLDHAVKQDDVLPSDDDDLINNKTVFIVRRT